MRARLQFLRNRRISNYGSRYQLWEQGDICGKLDKALLNFCLSAIKINDIA